MFRSLCRMAVCSAPCKRQLAASARAQERQTGGIAEQPGTGQRSAPNTNTQTTGQSITGLPPSNPTEAQAQRNRGAGTAPNGQPIGSSGSGLGSPEQPINSFNSGRR